MAVITLSHPPFSCGRAVAERVAAILGYRAIGREILIEASRRYDVGEADLFDAFESPPKNWWSRWRGNPRIHRVVLKATLYELAQAGNLVYHGRAGEAFFADVDRVLKVYLDAPTEMRVRQTAAHTSVCDEAAREYLARLDKIRARRMRELFHADWRDPERYHVRMHLGESTIEETAKRIAAVAQSSLFEPTPEWSAAFRDRVIAAAAEARLAVSHATRDLDLEIRVREGRVQLSGVIAAAGIKDAVVRTIETIPGVAEISTDFVVLPDVSQYSFPA
jgi:cytidylate kinase